MSSEAKPKVRVHTHSIEKVLSPIAEQVAQLVVLEERARQLNAGIPDLTGAAEAIGMAIQNLVKVGRESMGDGDEQLRTRMPAACEQIQAAGKLFMDATMKINMDPFDADGRQLLVQAARGLLMGTTNVLMTYDAAEVRKIVKLGENIIEHLAVSKNVENLEQLVVLMREISRDLMGFAQLCDARYQELINQTLANKLLHANETLRKSSPLLVTSLRTFIQNSDNDQARAARDYTIEQVMNATHDAIVVVTSDAVSDDHGAEVDQEVYVRKFEAADVQLLAVDAGLNQEELRGNIKAVIAHGNEVAQGCINPPRADVLRAAVEKVTASWEALQSTDNPALLGSAADQLRADIQTLDQHIKTAVVEEVTAAMGEEPVAANLKSAAAEGGANLSETITAFDDMTANLVRVSDHVAAMSLDSRRVKLIDETQKQLKNCAVQLSNAARLAHSEPDSQAAKEHLALVHDAYQYRHNVLRATVMGMVDPARVIVVVEDRVQGDLMGAQKQAMRGNIDGVLQHFSSVEKQAATVVSTAAVEVENSKDDDFKRNVSSAAHSINTALPLVKRDLEILCKNPEDKDAQAKSKHSEQGLKLALESMRCALAGEEMPSDTPSEADLDISMAVTNFQQRQLAAELGEDGDASAAEEADAADASADASAEAQESVFDSKQPPTGPIAVAALSLKRETDRWRSANNPVIATAKKMAEQMATMAKLSNISKGSAGSDDEQGSKGNMIATARGIAEQAHGIRKQALEAATNCTDKRLAADLHYLCERLPTIATQLKIIASVKAASISSASSEADAMLVKNAQNLMDTVQQTVRACEAASIKTMSKTAGVVSAAIRWKRKARRTT
eukprot:m.45074 g.45074  ORF g.45074 m.45074 type:complete len:847 (+) comp10863_c0_seq1:830-3370(+)